MSVRHFSWKRVRAYLLIIAGVVLVLEAPSLEQALFQNQQEVTAGTAIGVSGQLVWIYILNVLFSCVIMYGIRLKDRGSGRLSPVRHILVPALALGFIELVIFFIMFVIAFASWRGFF